MLNFFLVIVKTASVTLADGFDAALDDNANKITGDALANMLAYLRAAQQHQASA